MEIKELMTRQGAEEGAEINIIHPTTGEKTDVFIKLLGIDSKAWRSAVRAEELRGYLLLKEDKSESFEVDDCLILASVTVGWRGLTNEGVEVEFSKEECKKLYTESPFIFDQVNRFVENRRNFMKG